MRSLKLSLITLFLFVIAACGGSGGSGGSMSTQPSGASLQGSLDPASLASVQGTIQVSVSGGSQSGMQTTQIDSNGKFRFDGLAAGSADLHFKGSGVDATVTVSGLMVNQTLNITVIINGHTVQVQNQNEVDIRGKIATLTPPKFTVAGQTITTDANTEFNGATSLADFKVGDEVHVKGTLQADGSVLADEVERENEQEQMEADVEGQITSITPPNTFMVGNTKVVTNAATQFEADESGGGGSRHDQGGDDGGEHETPITFADLKVGQNVEVKGVTQPDGSILATSVEVKNEQHH
jgi:hypothetical protein